MMKTKTIQCPKCDGRGYISHVETWSDGNGVGGGRAWSEPCANCNGTGRIETPMTNYDVIKNMTIEEMAEFLKSMVDDYETHNVGCYCCINYGTHHSDPANKDNGLYECEGCENEGIGLDLVKWLKTKVIN